jgi:PmbA protein
MSVLSAKQCEEIFGMVERAAHARGIHEVETLIASGAEALTRFANNTIHQNVAERNAAVSVRVIADQRTARASTNVLDRASLEAATERAIEIARSLPPDEELLPLASPAPVTPVNRYFRTTAECSPEARGGVVANAIRIVEAEGQTAAGIYSTEESAEALFNSNGVSAYHTETMARFSITAMAGDSSGWAKASSPDAGAFSPMELARRAAMKAARSESPRKLDAGRYMVVLEPAAVLDLVGQIFGDFSGTALADQRSFLSGRMDKQLFGDFVSISDDVFHPLQSGAPFDGEGVPRKHLTLVDNGSPHELAYSRAAAKRAGVQPTGHGFPVPNEIGEAPVNIVIRGGSASIDDLIASTDYGVLITRLWYIREVDPYEKIMTGMTRDGTFLIENGKVTHGLRQFRFNQGVVELLNNVIAMTPEIRCSGEEAFDMVAPAMQVRDFNFTEVTTF